MGNRRRAHSQPLTTADRLAQAVHSNQPPQHRGTCEFYGFNRAPSSEDKQCLLGLYAGLIKRLNISPETIHDWGVRGVLVDEIKTAFYRLPEDSRGLYFPWFLHNEHVIASAGRPLFEKEICDSYDAIWRRAWVAIGGSEHDSPEEIKVAVSRRPAEERRCYALYMLLLSACPLSLHFDLWIKFGFASCTSEEEEGMLCDQYRRLITLCTFGEFCNAHRNRRLLGLFHSKGLQVSGNTHLQNLLSSHLEGRKESVWVLKKYVVHGPFSGEESGMITPFILDYGFINCRSADDWQQLQKAYKDFFTIHHGDPTALYKACTDRNIYGYLSNVMPGLPLDYQRLLTSQPHSVLSPYMRNSPWNSTWQVSPFVLLAFGAVLGAFVMYRMQMHSS